MSRIEATSDPSTWNSWRESNGPDDIYYDFDHAGIWADEWSCEPVGVRFEGAGGSVHLIVLRDPLDRLDGGAGRCDVKTPYDFGGPLVRPGTHGAGAVLEAFQPAWDDLLRSWGAVTEFQRLHPFLHPWLEDGVRPSGTQHHADNHVVDLSEGYDAVRAGYYSSWRRNLRKAERADAAGEQAVRVIEEPSSGDVAAFAALYAKTMARVDAKPWYLFTDATHDRLLARPDVALVRVDVDDAPAAILVSLRSGDSRFYHLGSSDFGVGATNPNHLAFDTLIRHAITTGAKRVHLGAGAPSLRRFKSRIANTTVPYYVVKRVVDAAALQELCSANALDPDAAFPPWLGS